MLSQRRGEAWAAPESDHSKSLLKGHCRPSAPVKKVAEKAIRSDLRKKKRPRSGVQTPSALSPTSFRASKLRRYKAWTVIGSTREDGCNGVDGFRSRPPGCGGRIVSCHLYRAVAVRAAACRGTPGSRHERGRCRLRDF